MSKLEFKPEDFSRAEMQRRFGADADWFYDRLAGIANARLQEMLDQCPVVKAMEVWMNKLSGDLVIAAELYAGLRCQDGTIPVWLMNDLTVFQPVGIGIENHHGVMFVLPEGCRDQFEVIGEF